MRENENPGVKYPNRNMEDPTGPKEKTLLNFFFF